MTLEELINESCKTVAEKHNIGSNLVTGHKSAYFKEAMLLALQQVREATIKECIKTLQLEHRIYNVNGEYKSELLGQEILYDIDEPWNYIGMNTKELENLNLNTIKLWI